MGLNFHTVETLWGCSSHHVELDSHSWKAPPVGASEPHEEGREGFLEVSPNLRLAHGPERVCACCSLPTSLWRLKAKTHFRDHQ